MAHCGLNEVLIVGGVGCKYFWRLLNCSDFLSDINRMGSKSLCKVGSNFVEEHNNQLTHLSRFSTRRNILRAVENLLFFIEFCQKRTLKSQISSTFLPLKIPQTNHIAHFAYHVIKTIAAPYG